MLESFTCAVVCPPPAPVAPEIDPFSDEFSFRRAQNAACRNAESALALAQKAAEGADLVVLPEDIHGIRHFWRAVESPNMLRRLAEPVPGPTTRSAARIARRSRCHLSLTLYEVAGHSIYNTTVLLGHRGKVLATYRKTHLAPGEDWLVTPGEELSVIKTRLGTIGMVCGEDYLFPEVACVLARLGAEIVLCPSKSPIPEIILCCRAFESGFVTVYAQPDGSALIDRRGSVLAHSAGRRNYSISTRFIPQPSPEGERAELERLLTGVADPRARLSSRRRPELYGVLVEAKWPEAPRPAAKGVERIKRQAHGLLAQQWEEGPVLLPEWET
jgi:predicted amidohydrolase